MTTHSWSGVAKRPMRISWDHAQVIVADANPRIVDQVAGIQEEFVAAAVGTVFERWRQPPART